MKNRVWGGRSREIVQRLFHEFRQEMKVAEPGYGLWRGRSRQVLVIFRSSGF